MARITVKAAEALDGIAVDLQDNVGVIRDVLANLQDEDVKGEDRDDSTAEVEQGLEELCSNVRAFAKRRKLPEPDLDNIPDNTEVVYVLPVFFAASKPLGEAERRYIENCVDAAFLGLEVGELTVAWEREGLPKKQPVG